MTTTRMPGSLRTATTTASARVKRRRSDPSLVGRKPRAAKTPQPALPQIEEWEFQANILELAITCGWLWAHKPEGQDQKKPPRVPPGKRGLKTALQETMGGEPDLLLVRAPRVALFEIKTENGRIRPKQKRWLSALAQCPGVESYLFRPSDWDAIVEVLR